jgi:predicted glycosyltransferase
VKDGIGTSLGTHKEHREKAYQGQPDFHGLPSVNFFDYWDSKHESTASMRSILFCNEMLGLGHLRLSLVLAEALVNSAAGATALVVTGSPAFGALRLPPSVDILKLPTAPVTPETPWNKTKFHPGAGLAIRHEEVAALRAQLSLAAIERFRPDILLSDHRPLGRLGDLRPALGHLRSRSRSTIALGLWEVDDAPERLETDWNPQLLRDVRALYDLVLVYGPPIPGDVRIQRLTEARMPVHCTGLVAGPPANAGALDLGDGYLLAMAGGGVDGFHLINAVLDAIRMRPLDVPAVLLTGPMMQHSAVATLRNSASGLAVQVLEFRPDMAAVIAGARAIVAMAGYCTVSEVLASGKPALLVPRTFPREEQFNRARRLAAQGRVSMLLPNELDPITLRGAIVEILDRQPAAPELLTGAADAASILTRAMAQRHPAWA